MSQNHKTLEHLIELWRLCTARLRGKLVILRGAEGGRKLKIGRHCAFYRPQAIQFGERISLDTNVCIKILADEAKCEIGSYTFMGNGVQLDIIERVTIGSHVLIAPGTLIVDHNHSIAPSMRIDQQACTSSQIIIEDDVWIGANATILAGVRLGKGSVIGAGAVVTSNVDAMAIVGGVPARRIGNRDQ